MTSLKAEGQVAAIVDAYVKRRESEVEKHGPNDIDLIVALLVLILDKLDGNQIDRIN